MVSVFNKKSGKHTYMLNLLTLITNPYYLYLHLPISMIYNCRE
jgi:hypothetical protein